MKHCIAIANKTQAQTAVDNVLSIERLNELGIRFGPVPDQYQSIHRLVDEPIWYVDCDGETRHGHDYGHVPEVQQTHMWTGFFWAVALESALALAIIVGFHIWRFFQ